MKFEYLIFNIIVISGPIFFGSLKKFLFIPRIKIALISLSVPLLPFLIWDSLVTGRHWDFNNEYITGVKFFDLPIEEILFFITVPFACLFTWEMINRFLNTGIIKLNRKIYQTPIILITISSFLYLYGKEYTGLALFALSISILYDLWIKSYLFIHKNFILYSILILLFTLIFNGYLTWRPVVTYNEVYQLNFRIITIPIEDFIYGLALLYISTSTYYKITKRKNV